MTRLPDPADVTPMAATATDRRVFDDAWAFERKLDGFRCLAWVDETGVRLRSRNGLAYDDRFPEIAAALAATAHGPVVVDGELVAVSDGRSTFSLLQQRLGMQAPVGDGPRRPKRTDIAVQYVVFDLLWFDGHDLRPMPLEVRQQTLPEVVDFIGPVVRSEALPGDAQTLLAAACELGWEGLIAKRLASTYQPRRSRDWLKLKCSNEQEVVVGGFTEPQGSRTAFGALLVGVHDAEGLRYAGKVGTGFEGATLRTLHRELLDREAAASPFVDPVRERGTHWVRPELVVQVGFAEWTEAGHLRHPRYLGQRFDKAPESVVREPVVREPGT